MVVVVVVVVACVAGVAGVALVARHRATRVATPQEVGIDKSLKKRSESCQLLETNFLCLRHTVGPMTGNLCHPRGATSAESFDNQDDASR